MDDFITDEDRKNFPELFITRKQLVIEEKANAGKTIRAQLQEL